MKKKKYIFALIVLLVAVITLTSCAPGNFRWDPEKTPGNEAGFWAGIWHGIIIVITFIISLFTDRVGLYEPNNNGWRYNLGFLIGLAISMGGVLRGSRKARKRKARKNEWDEIAGKIEEKVRSGIKSWFEEQKEKQKEKDWDEIADMIEEKIKKVLREWAGK
jgi:hypothetical protein